MSHDSPDWDPIARDLAERLKQDQYGIRTKEQQKRIDEIRAASWLLLTNEHRAKCGRCGKIHPYITLGCIERPFNGLDELYSFETSNAREQGLIRGENVILSESHVQSMRIGAPEPISRKVAKRLILRIRAKLGRKAI